MERKRILIAVNNPPELEKLRKFLATAGYEVKVADNGARALALSRDFRPHLIFSELNLSKIDGHHLLRELKSHSATKSIPFVLMSPHRSVNERVHSIELGIDDYVSVPFDIREVAARFDIILNEVRSSEAQPKRQSRGFAGKLTDMNVIELVQTLAVGQKSGIVSLQSGDDDGLIRIQEGEVVDAVLDDFPPRDALFKMFTWSDGFFKVKIKPVEQQSEFEQSTEELIAQGLMYRDRWEKVSKYLPSLQTTIKLAQATESSQLSTDEKNVLTLVNGNTRILDLVSRTKLEDLRALRIVARLFHKGSIQELTHDEERAQRKDACTGGQSDGNSAGRLSNLVGSFLNPNKKQTQKPGSNKHRLNGRKSPQERTNLAGPENRTYLNKSELLMIREKLLNRRNAKPHRKQSNE